MSNLSREELYDLVWSKTMRDAAATIPLSDVGLKKECRRRGIPVPPQGYWNKVRAGHRMPPRPPLPPDKPAPPPAASRVVRMPTPAKVRGERQDELTTRERSPAQGHAEGSREDHQQRKAARPAAKRKSRTRKKRRPKEAYYVMPIDRWEWDYGFGINNIPKFASGHYSDNRHLVVHGRLLRPASVAGTAARLRFVPSDIREEAKRYGERPTHVGTMWKYRRDQGLESVISMPEDILPSLLPMLLAERLRYVVLRGTPLFRLQAEVHSYRFEPLVHFDDLPPDAV